MWIVIILVVVFFFIWSKWNLNKQGRLGAVKILEQELHAENRKTSQVEKSNIPLKDLNVLSIISKDITKKIYAVDEKIKLMQKSDDEKYEVDYVKDALQLPYDLQKVYRGLSDISTDILLLLTGNPMNDDSITEVRKCLTGLKHVSNNLVKIDNRINFLLPYSKSVTNFLRDRKEIPDEIITKPRGWTLSELMSDIIETNQEIIEYVQSLNSN